MDKGKIENLFIDVSEFYDFDPRNIVKNDIPFYIEYASKAENKKVLELACGTGRVSIPLARAGFDVTGLDLSPAMLSLFKKKLDAEPYLKEKINIVHADMSNFFIAETFGLIIIPFRAFQVLVSDEAALSCLRCVREHMSPKGMFIIDVFEPYSKLNGSWVYPERLQWDSVDLATGNRILKYDEGYKIDTGKQIIYVKQTYKTERDGKTIREATDHLRLRYYYYDQIVSLIRQSGLAIKEEYGFYDKSPQKSGREMIFVVVNQSEAGPTRSVRI